MEEDIKKNWTGTHFRRPCEESLSEVMLDKRRTALQNLAQRYRRFSNVALIMIAWSVCIFFAASFGTEHRLLTSIVFGVYFLVCSIMDYWLYRGVSSIDVAEMSVSEVIRKALFYRKRHLQFMIILIPMAIGILSLVIWQVTGNEYMLMGIAFGAMAGLAIGTRMFLKFMADYRTLTSDLK